MSIAMQKGGREGIRTPDPHLAVLPWLSLRWLVPLPRVLAPNYSPVHVTGLPSLPINCTKCPLNVVLKLKWTNL